VLRWFFDRMYYKKSRVIAGTHYHVIRFRLLNRDELEWVQSIWSAIGAHMFAREYDPECCNWDCELRIPKTQQEGDNATGE